MGIEDILFSSFYSTGEWSYSTQNKDRCCAWNRREKVEPMLFRITVPAGHPGSACGTLTVTS